MPSKSPHGRFTWKQLFSMSVIGLAVSMLSAIFAYLQWQQALASDIANANLATVINAQLKLQQTIATAQAQEIGDGPKATTIAQEIAGPVSTLDALGVVRLQVEATLTAIALHPFHARTNVLVFSDDNRNGVLESNIDSLYSASDFALPLRVEYDNGLQPGRIITVRDSDDGLVDGSSRLNIDGNYQVAHVAFDDKVLSLTDNYQDISNRCSGPPLSPDGCVHGALLYNQREATLRLLVQPAP